MVGISMRSFPTFGLLQATTRSYVPLIYKMYQVRKTANSKCIQYLDTQDNLELNYFTILAINKPERTF